VPVTTLDEIYSNKKLMSELKACPVEATLRFIGKRWTILILREMFRGVTQFNRFLENIKGINPRMLSLRLKELERCGIIEKQITSEYPLRASYKLTELGRRSERILVQAALYSMRNMPGDVFKRGRPRNLERLLGNEP
jgi:DNA-binding HxlR family transcriptional regulator